MDESQIDESQDYEVDSDYGTYSTVKPRQNYTKPTNRGSDELPDDVEYSHLVHQHKQHVQDISSPHYNSHYSTLQADHHGHHSLQHEIGNIKLDNITLSNEQPHSNTSDLHTNMHVNTPHKTQQSREENALN